MEFDKDLQSIQEVRNLVAKAKAAQAEFATFSQERVDAVVKAIAQACEKEAERLAKMAVEETGFGISDYVKAARIERAKILLETSDSSVQEISDKLGFTTRNYFTRCFREITGKTPMEYRNHR